MHQPHRVQRGLDGLRIGVLPAAFGLLLSACGGATSSGGGDSPTPSSAHPSLGILRISVTGLGTQTPTATAVNVAPNTPVDDATPGGLHAKTLSAQPCFIQVESPALSSGAFSFNGEQYVAFTFAVRNAQGESYTSGSTKCTANTANTSPLSNVSLLGIVEPGLAISNTPFISLKDFAGNNVSASVATTILPTHGMTFDSTRDVPAVSVGEESLQVFTEAQIASLAADPDDASGTYLMPYGYVVRNVNPALGRTLQASPAAGEYDGQFTYAVKLPTSADNVFSFTIDLQAVTDSVTKVTQSVEEQNPLGDLAANLRALNLASTDLVSLGGSHVTSTNLGDPLCTVRIAGTAASPSADLVKNTTANVASAPYNLTGLSTTGPINVGFCQPMTEPAAIYSQFAVTASQSGARPNSNYGSYTGASTPVLQFQPSSIHPFLPGEQVAYTLTASLASTSSKNPTPFTGSFTVGGLLASVGQFVPVTTTVTGPEPLQVIAADFNQDGLMDLATANMITGTVTVLLGNGDGTYHPTTGGVVEISGGTHACCLVAGDFNGDGIPDLAVVNQQVSSSNTVQGSIAILLGSGNGTFSQPNAAITLGAQPQAIAIGDFSGDGKAIDLAVANGGNSSSLSILIDTRDGTGNFTSASGSPILVQGDPNALATGDFNGDGKTDLAVSTGATVAVLLRGSTAGTFTAASGSPFSVGNDPTSIAVGDFNEDGAPDLAVANYEDSPADLSILLNKANGSGSFNNATTVAVGTHPYALVSGDFNGDGRADLAVSNQGVGTVSVLLGSGSGTFTAAAGSPIVAGSAGLLYGLARADLNGDGRSDLVLTSATSPGQVVVLLGEGNGVFYPPIPPRSPAVTTPVGSLPQTPVAADFNGDGLMDFAVTNAGSGTVSVFLGETGGFVQATGSPVKVGNFPVGLVAGDFNKDGKPDLAVTNLTDGTVSILLNTGTGSSTGSLSVSGAAIPVGSHPESIAAGDFNGDGDLDLVVVNAGVSTASILMGTGSGGFATPTSSNTFNLGTSASSVTVADFNSDGKLDLAFGTFATSAQPASPLVMLGNGSGGFTAAGGTPLDLGGGSVVSGDFNGDGKPDLVLLPSSGSENSFDLLLGKGDGSFTVAAGSPFKVGSGANAVAVGDFNGDGDADVAVTNENDNTVSILLGNGAAGFMAAANSPVYVGTQPVGVAVGAFFLTPTLGLAVANEADDTVVVLPQR